MLRRWARALQVPAPNGASLVKAARSSERGSLRPARARAGPAESRDGVTPVTSPRRGAYPPRHASTSSRSSSVGEFVHATTTWPLRSRSVPPNASYDCSVSSASPSDLSTTTIASFLGHKTWIAPTPAFSAIRSRSSWSWLTPMARADPGGMTRWPRHRPSRHHRRRTRPRKRPSQAASASPSTALPRGRGILRPRSAETHVQVDREGSDRPGHEDKDGKECPLHGAGNLPRG
jgi:hypothetical protein